MEIGTDSFAAMLPEPGSGRVAQAGERMAQLLAEIETAVLLDELAAATAEKLHLPMPADLRLRRIVDLMMVSPSDRSTLAAWAEQAGMSTRTMERTICRETGMTGAALAAELEVSTRTLYRDMAELMAQRVPITGEVGLGYLLAADYDMPPLMLTQVELEAIVLGAQWVAGRDDPLLSPAASDVLAKIATAVPAHLRPFVMAPSTGVPPRLVPVEEVVDAATLRNAIRSRSKLRLLYPR